MSYIAAAQKRFPNCRVIGDGPFCVVAPGVVYLSQTSAQQRNVAVSMEGAVMVDLQPTPVPSLRETAEDRYEERLRAKRGL